MSGVHKNHEGDCYSGCTVGDEITKPKRTIKFYAKTSDRFCCDVYEDGKQVNIETYDGYPPRFLGSDGVDLEIDLDTGQVQNWKVPTQEDLGMLIGSEDGLA